MKLSIVTTLYHSAPYIKEFYERIKRVAKKITTDYEIIFVDDGSPDRSLELVVNLSKKDKRIKVIELSRNFGHHKAMMTGLSYAEGEFVFLIDSDLEEKPEWLEMFFDKLNKEKCDVVYGVQRKRKGNWFEKISGSIFYFLINFLTNLKLQKNLITARLMTKSYVKSLIKHREHEVFLAGLWQITGYNQIPMPVNKTSKSISTYSLRHKFSILLNSITSFSNKPLIYIFYIGFVISFLAFIHILYLLVQKLVFANPITGWVSVMVSIWFLGGIIILFVGVVGIYISKIFMETKHRPYTLIKNIYEFKKICK